MVDFRSSGVKEGGLGIFKQTQQLTSPASSSLDKPAGTLSQKSSADLAAAGQAAQRLTSTVPRAITDDYTASERSYAYTEALFKSDVLLAAESDLLKKFVSQASPEQKSSLIKAVQESTTEGFQRAVLERVNESIVEGETGIAGINPLLLLGGLFVAYEVFK